MEQEYKYMVVTRCFTFNHASYIVDAMNGFTMQETTFPVITLIVDDASTDGEPEVIKQYLAEHFQAPYRKEETEDYHLICANHNTNPNCTFVVFLLKYNHYSIKKAKFPYLAEWLDNAKYHALCEGDDYWIHPGKLQIQVNYMEKNGGCSLCFHNAFTIKELNGVSSVCLFNDYFNSVTLTIEDAVNKWVVPTASILYRSKDENLPAWVPRIYSSDYSRVIYSMYLGDVCFVNIIASVYRFIRSEKSTSMSSAMHGRGIFIMKQHLMLLEAFDNGPNPVYNNVIRKRISYLKNDIIYHESISQNRYWQLLSILPYITEKIFNKIFRFK